YDQSSVIKRQPLTQSSRYHTLLYDSLDMSQTPRGNYALSSQINMENMDQVEVVRSRMIQVNDAQGEFLAGFDVNDTNVNWVDYLNRYNIFLSKHTGLSNTFIDSNFKKIVLHPKEIPPEDQEELISTLLRTKPIPEIAQKEKQIKHDISVEEGLDGLEKDAKEDKNDETKWDRLLKEWESRYNEHRDITKNASMFCEDVIGKMDIKCRME
ncbi:6568_t:CDS:2, partial [Acaulospora morrowiae]